MYISSINLCFCKVPQIVLGNVTWGLLFPTPFFTSQWSFNFFSFHTRLDLSKRKKALIWGLVYLILFLSYLKVSQKKLCNIEFQDLYLKCLDQVCRAVGCECRGCSWGSYPTWSKLLCSFPSKFCLHISWVWTFGSTVVWCCPC